MRRPRPSWPVPATVIAAAFVMGAAVFAPALASSDGCITVDPANFAPAVMASSVIVVAAVGDARAEGGVTLRPEAYLRGAARSGDLPLAMPAAGATCPPATFRSGERVVAVLAGEDGALLYPGAAQVWTLSDGHARSGAGDERLESELIGQLRGVTGQYAVPAKDAGERAALDWVGTVLPVGGGLLVVFAISLVLMRLWHRIDPS